MRFLSVFRSSTGQTYRSVFASMLSFQDVKHPAFCRAMRVWIGIKQNDLDGLDLGNSTTGAF